MRLRQFSLAMAIIIPIQCYAVEVSVVPLKGPCGTAKITPPDGSATAYRMDFPGQKAICIKSVGVSDVYVSTASSVGSDGFPLSTGESLCADLSGGTTLYFQGDGASGDIRVFIAR